MTLLIHILNQIKQGAQNKNKSIKIKNISKNPKLCIELLMLLQKQGFIQTFYFIQNQKFFDLCVLLKYNTNNQNTITNLNIYSSEGKLKNIKIRSLWKIKSGFGVLILMTPFGLLTDIEARIKNCGGFLLCSIV